MLKLLSTGIIQELGGFIDFCEHIFRILPSQYFILAQLYEFNISGIPNAQPIPGR